MSSSTRIRNNSNVYWKISECNASDVSFSASLVDSELLFTFFRLSWGIQKKEISLSCTLKCSGGNGWKKSWNEENSLSWNVQVNLRRLECLFEWHESYEIQRWWIHTLIWFSKKCCFPMISSSGKTWFHQIQPTSKASAQFNPLFHSSYKRKAMLRKEFWNSCEFPIQSHFLLCLFYYEIPFSVSWLCVWVSMPN